MKMVSVRVVSYFLLSLLFSEGFLGSSRGFEFLSFPDLINNATHLYGPPINRNDLLSTAAGGIFFPCMNFTCSGKITKLMFIAPIINRTLCSRVQWPQFWLLRQRNCQTVHQCFTSWLNNMQLSVSQRNCNPVYRNGGFGVYELDFSTNDYMTLYSFEPGDFLGVSYPAACPSGCQRQNVLYQNGGGYCEANVIRFDPQNDQLAAREYPVLPYIALETDAGDYGELCKGNYLNEQSLWSIINASRESTGYMTFSPSQQTVDSVPLSKSGNAFKVLIAARLNHSATYNSSFSQNFNCSSVSDSAHPPWPTIDIIRNINRGRTFLVSICHEPRPSGYLNVFEYELTGNVHVGDVVRIRVPWPHSPETSKYLLAYLNGSQPMVYINTSRGEQPETTSTMPNDASVSESTTHDTYYNTYSSSDGSTSTPVTMIAFENTCMNTRPTPESTTYGDHTHSSSTRVTTAMSENENLDNIYTDLTLGAGINQQVVLISSGLTCTLVLIIAITVTVVIAFVLIYRRRKNSNSFSPRSTDVLDNDYVHNEMLPVGGQSVGNRQAESGEHDGGRPCASNDQQEDYYFYKVYEWGVFVPTVAEREAATATVTNTEADVDTLYSTLGESQYSTLLQFNQSPDFFHESDDYWTPASDERSLYQQLSSKKFREILRSQIETSNQLGSGEFGTVMKGVWLLSGGSKEVAVKVLKEGSSEEDKVKFLQEAAINGQFWHPNVVRLMGVVTVGEPTMIVLEYLTNGDLRNYVMKMQPTPGEMVSTNTPHTLLRFCKEIASGMKYLAQKKFVHRDLAARNILLSEEKTCKIGDFGMSRNLEDDSYYVSHGGMIPVKWTAPEALHYKKYSTSSDVWSFGALLYEIWSLGHKPFEGYSNREVMRKVDAGFRLPPPPGCPRDIYQLMIKCWHSEKTQRPSFSDLHASLSDHGLSLQLRNSDADAKLHPLALTIGAPLESSKELYTDLQNTYT